MLLTNDDDLYNMVRQAPVAICVLDAETRSADVVNDRFQEVFSSAYNQIDGKLNWDALPEIKSCYEKALDTVVQSGKPYHGDEVEVMITRHGQQDLIPVSFVYSPVKNKDGNISKIAIWVYEKSSQADQRQELKTSNKKLETTNQEYRSVNEKQHKLLDELSLSKRQLQIERDRLNHFFMQVPAGICVLEGQDHIYTLVNPAYQKLFPGRQLQGLTVVEALPELKGTPIEEILDNVYTTGKTFEANFLLVPLAYTPDGLVEDRYFNFVYQARINANNQVDGILVLVFEATAQAVAQKKIEELNSRLSVKNKEFADTNQKLKAQNTQLGIVQQQMEQMNLALIQSRERFRNIIHTSPIAILVTRGDNMVFEEINSAMLDIIGKDASVQGKTWFEAIPELVSQPIIKELSYTYRAGKENKISAVPVTLIRNGLPHHGYYDATYTPLIEDGKIVGVIQFVVDVTRHITSKDELAKAYEQIRLSKEAAELGTFDMNMENGYMEWDSRCRQLFGINHQNEVSFENDFLANLHPEDQPRVRATLDDVFDKSVCNGVYDIEYRTLGVEDKQMRWVRAKGQVYFKSNNQPLRFIGSVLDITEQKQDEQRKSDFIGMASHELKTPLTSLNAYLQILQARAQKADDVFTQGALKKSVNQVRKMTNMVNGFLNVSRLQSGKINIESQNFDMADLFRELDEETAAIITSHNIIFVPVKQIFINADRDKIDQVISNLISNAVKYSPLGSMINISCVTKERYVQINVTDQGTGIKIEDQHKLFDRYYRVESSAKNIAGFGIGLYLCAEIIQRHNGKIWLESKVGEGSTFYFSLPLA